jgi:hypothetical protein
MGCSMLSMVEIAFITMTSIFAPLHRLIPKFTLRRAQNTVQVMPFKNSSASIEDVLILLQELKFSTEQFKAEVKSELQIIERKLLQHEQKLSEINQISSKASH